jgi:hypothetical protein
MISAAAPSSDDGRQMTEDGKQMAEGSEFGIRNGECGMK